MIDKITRSIIEEAKNFTHGQKKHYPEYNFTIEKGKIYYFNDITGLHLTGSATGLAPHIRKAIKNKQVKNALS